MIISKLTSKAQTTIPQPVRAALRLREGDELAYVIEEGRVMLMRKPPEPEDDPFGTFSEWGGEADTKPYAGLGSLGRGEGPFSPAPMALCSEPWRDARPNTVNPAKRGPTAGKIMRTVDSRFRVCERIPANHPHRHSRESGNPGEPKECRALCLDSRFRGNDDLGRSGFFHTLFRGNNEGAFCGNSGANQSQSHNMGPPAPERAHASPPLARHRNPGRPDGGRSAGRTTLPAATDGDAATGDIAHRRCAPGGGNRTPVRTTSPAPPVAAAEIKPLRH
jgi:antitoxin PrlF